MVPSSLRLVLAACVSYAWIPFASAALNAPLVFELNSHPDAVAVQFDVLKSGDNSISLSAPRVLMDSPHAVESAVLSSGATRFVVYSTVGQKISPSGKITVSFASMQPAASGRLSVNHVVASDGEGRLVASAPNALPIVIGAAPSYRSLETGVAANLTAPVADLDGSVVSVEYLIGGTLRGLDTTPPFILSWSPSLAGSLTYVIVVRDNQGAVTEFDFGTLRTYNPSDVASFPGFASIHFGPDAAPNSLAFAADPLSSGIANGVAWLLDINPHTPDRARLPAATVEILDGQPHLVFRFVRNASITAPYQIYGSPNLLAWELVPASRITERPLGPNRIEVTARRPLSSVAGGRYFMELEVEKPL